MKKRTHKVLGLNTASFDLKRMELLKYHNDLYTAGSATDSWLSVLSLVLASAMFAPNPGGNPDDRQTKEE